MVTGARAFRAWITDRLLRAAAKKFGGSETVMQPIVIGPGGNTGWHTHAGPVVVLVKAGELTLYAADDPTCTGRTYRAGQAFIDSGQGHVDYARNRSLTDNTELGYMAI